MKQRREDARNIAMIAGSGLLGAVAAVVGMSLFEAANEARHQEDAAWEVHELRPGRFRAEISVNRDRRTLTRVVREERELTPVVREEMVLHLSESGEATLQSLRALQAELLSAELRRQIEEVQAELEAAVESVRRARAEEPARIRLRSAAAAPAIYIDGVRINAPIADINLDPEEIESVDVVKAPAAVEQYGEEGENGVIVITTKRPGKKRKGGGGR